MKGEKKRTGEEERRGREEWSIEKKRGEELTPEG